MQQIHNFQEANAALLPYVPLVAQLTGKDTTLERIKPLMEHLGNPHHQLKVVHIAGTSGKTSTAYFMAALLQAARQRVGLTVSPHIDSIAERVQIDGTPLNEKKFCDLLGQFLAMIEPLPLTPAYFELLYAFSIWVFAQEQVEYAVVETGMGGLHDATNVINNADKLCIITDIGFDHMKALGNTLEAIAAQKAGIIHPGNTAIMYKQAASITDVVRTWAAKQPAELLLTTEAAERATYDRGFVTGLPLYQQRNWLLARKAYEFLAKRDHLPVLMPQELIATQQVRVPARMDVRQLQGKTIIMDGAHNQQKMQTFLRSFQQLYPHIRPVVLLALKEGKEPYDIAPLIAELTDHVILTIFDTSQDLPAKSINPNELATIFQAAGIDTVKVIPDQHLAYKELLRSAEEVGIITGSFYLISQLRQHEL